MLTSQTPFILSPIVSTNSVLSKKIISDPLSGRSLTIATKNNRRTYYGVTAAFMDYASVSSAALL